MDVTAHELRTIKLREAFRGYRQEDVDQLLDRVAATIERLQGQAQRLSDRLEAAESEAGLGREADEMLRRTLLLAQRTADSAVAEAQERARRVVSESEAHAHSIVSGAEEEARRIAIAERQRIEGEIRDLGRRRDTLLADVEALEQASADHRRRLREFLESELARVDARPAAESPPIPPVHDVDIPPPVEAPVGEGAAGEAEAPTATGPVANETIDDVAVPEKAVDLTAAETSADPPADAADAADEVSLEDGPDILPKRRRWRLREGEGEAAPPPDDRFFDDLRQAVADDTPLGPREDDPDHRDEGEPTGEYVFHHDEGRGPE